MKHYSKQLISVFFITVFVFAVNANAQVTKQLEAKKDKSTQLWGYENTGEQEYWWKEAHSQGADEELMNYGMDTEWVIPCQYNMAAKEFSEGLAGVEIGNKVGFIDKNNRFIITPQYEPMNRLKGFSHGLAVAKKDGKFGFINKQGIFVIPPVFDYADNFEDDLLATVKMGKKFGAIDFKGDTIVPCTYLAEEAMKYLPFKNKEYKEAVKIVKTRYEDGYYDTIMKPVEAIAETVNKLIRDEMYLPTLPQNVVIRQEGALKGLGIADNDTAWVLRPNFSEIIHINNLFYQVQDTTHQWGIADIYGRMILPCNFENIEYQSDVKLFIVTRKPYQLHESEFGNRMGLYNWKGELILPTVLEQISLFKDGYAEACIDELCGQIDLNGQVSMEYMNELLATSPSKTGAAYTYYMARLVGLHPACAQVHNNIAMHYMNLKSYKEGIRRLKLAHKLDPNDRIIADNLKNAKDDRRNRRFDRVINALEVTGQVLDAAATTYTAVSGNTSVSSTSSSYINTSTNETTSNDTSYSSIKEQRTKSTENSSRQTTAEMTAKNTDSRTYSNYEDQLIKMNTYYERDYNDGDRRRIQQQMKKIRTKWINKGYSFWKSDWEDWNGVKR